MTDDAPTLHTEDDGERPIMLVVRQDPRVALVQADLMMRQLNRSRLGSNALVQEASRVVLEALADYVEVAKAIATGRDVTVVAPPEVPDVGA